MIKTNYRVSLHESALKGLVVKYDTPYSLGAAAEMAPCAGILSCCEAVSVGVLPRENK